MPRSRPMKRWSQGELDECCKQVAFMPVLDQGWIVLSSASHAASVVFARKPDRTWRFCQDFQGLNAIAQRSVKPLPHVDQLVDKTHGARFFTKLDLAMAYMQFRISEEDRTRAPLQRVALLQDDEWRQDASQGARAQRVAAQRRAHGAQVGTVALSRPRRAPFLVIKFGLSPARGVRRTRSSFDNLAKSSGARAFTKWSHLGLSAPKAPALFSNAILSRSRRPVRISCLRL
jgi:hypothetical protein